VFRWATVNRPELRRWIAADVVGMPLPGLVAATNGPVARLFQRQSSAYDEQVRAEIGALPGRLDRIDALIAEGTIGGAEPNAADFQIGTTVRVLLAFDDFRGAVEGRPAAELAMRILPEYPGPVAPILPPEWLAPLRG
jgi:glutathione S-transferase